ncbi:hypothetical protein HJW77_14580 [Klebsiella pneumoniae]|nr:hypothetical protein HJW77_14580 [Klebsiella pneumoniae]
MAAAAGSFLLLDGNTSATLVTEGTGNTVGDVEEVNATASAMNTSTSLLTNLTVFYEDELDYLYSYMRCQPLPEIRLRTSNRIKGS